MTTLLAFILGLVQGITEFLPISSDGHLVLFQQLLPPSLGDDYNHLAFDVFLHMASLLVILFFVRSEIILCLKSVYSTAHKYFFERDQFSMAEAKSTWENRLVGLLLVGTIPAVVAGLTFEKVIEETFQSLYVAALGFLVTSGALFTAHHFQMAEQNARRQSTGTIYTWILPSYKVAILIGLGQALAILPGVSRSGMTIAAAVICGMSITSAIRFSFLLGAPVIAGAGLLKIKSMLDISPEEYVPYLVGFVTTAITAWFALQFLTNLAKKRKLNWFATYTLVLGLTLYVLTATGYLQG